MVTNQGVREAIDVIDSIQQSQCIWNNDHTNDVADEH